MKETVLTMDLFAITVLLLYANWLNVFFLIKIKKVVLHSRSSHAMVFPRKHRVWTFRSWANQDGCVR